MNKAILTIALCACFFANAHAGNTPAIDGYSPVAYFTEGKAVRGSRKFAVQHDSDTYYLSNEEEVRLFRENPDKYQPRYKLCPYSLAHGGTLPLDPTNFAIVGGHLLLFHKSDEQDGLISFRESKLTEQELLERADKEYVLLRF